MSTFVTTFIAFCLIMGVIALVVLLGSALYAAYCAGKWHGEA